MTTATGALKRVFVGRPLRSSQMHETLLPKWLALPIFCSDPISSVAYATEEILLVTGYGGVAFLTMSKPIAPPLPCCSSSSSRPTGRRVTPTPAEAGRSSSVKRTSARRRH